MALAQGLHTVGILEMTEYGQKKNGKRHRINRFLRHFFLLLKSLASYYLLKQCPGADEITNCQEL